MQSKGMLSLEGKEKLTLCLRIKSGCGATLHTLHYAFTQTGHTHTQTHTKMSAPNPSLLTCLTSEVYMIASSL